MTGRRRVGWIAILAVVVVAFTRNAVEPPAPRTTRERVHAIAKTLRCPVCKSQSVADSDVAAARAIREELTRRIDDGQTDEMARDAIAANYGDDIVLVPPRSGVAGLVWTLPVIGLTVALLGLASAFRRWRRRPDGPVTDADRQLVERARTGWSRSGADPPC
jgi:cytochrome c-type biogenesis protein CcmH